MNKEPETLKERLENKNLVLERRELTRKRTLDIIKKKDTNVGLWGNTTWDAGGQILLDRAIAAVKLIPNDKRILDIGCWDMKLEKVLPSGCTYVPLDVMARDERTIVVNLNKDKLPIIQADFFVGLGVLEYIHDIPKLFRQLSRQFSSGLFSYYPMEKSPGKDRLSTGWVNSLNSTELIALMKAAGFRKVSVIKYKSTLHFYLMEKPAGKISA